MWPIVFSYAAVRSVQPKIVSVQVCTLYCHCIGDVILSEFLSFKEKQKSWISCSQNERLIADKLHFSLLKNPFSWQLLWFFESFFNFWDFYFYWTLLWFHFALLLCDCYYILGFLVYAKCYLIRYAMQVSNNVNIRHQDSSFQSKESESNAWCCKK